MPTSDPVLARNIEIAADALVIVLSNRRVRIPWSRCSPKLARATAAERMAAELSPGGYGIHWPLLDEDLSVGGLLRRHAVADHPISKRRADKKSRQARRAAR